MTVDRAAADHMPHLPQLDPVLLTGDPLTIDAVIAVAWHGAPVRLTGDATARMEAARRVVDRVVTQEQTAYGINTGFGDLSRVRISSESTATLQRNLVRSHAAGVGPPLPRDIVRAMMLILVASLARGHSGVRPVLAQTIVAMLNRDVIPVVPETGSLGASGDLAPLAHIGLVMIGEGEALLDGARIPGGDALDRAGISPLVLEAKEGLAIINGTHMMAAIGALLCHDARVLVESAELAAAMSLEALRGTDVPFDPRIQRVRPQPGQAVTAAHVRDLLKGSEIIPSHRKNDPRVQDPYSLRCIPQVIGAIRDTLRHCTCIVETELGSVTDNPLIFPDDDAVLSGGNFHGQPIAMALDILAIALAELAAFSERRIYLLLDDREPLQNRLPAFLAREPGLNSGYMIAQYVAAALVAENAILASPAGVQSIPTSAGMEDFVSMGATAGNKLRRVLVNVEQVIAIELLCAAEGVEWRRPLLAGLGVEEGVRRVREIAPGLQQDRPLHPDIEHIAAAIHRGAFHLRD